MTLLLFSLAFYALMRIAVGKDLVHDGALGNSRFQAAEDRDPVCGRKVEILAEYSTMYRGKVVRFCSEECLESFRADPEHFSERVVLAGGRAPLSESEK